MKTDTIFAIGFSIVVLCVVVGVFCLVVGVYSDNKRRSHEFEVRVDLHKLCLEAARVESHLYCPLP